ncbi:MAG: acetaldehyde dehydrogenase (acetylating) [Desulfobacteraceae bacterium 4572_19]|nr:MAG: acetaldehyde dehydrogenase (acetylating) [Desulfobacteraceae bacterium 4572_19]
MVDKDLLSMQEARSLVRAARTARSKVEEMGQEMIDSIIKAIAEKAVERAEELAKMAVEETRFGKWKDKMAKNILASTTLFAHIKDMKTIGILNEDHEKKITEIATPAGVIAALIPSTNPTSTVIYKAIIALKAGNAVVFSPHPSALKCIRETVDMIRGTLSTMNAPEDLVSTMSIPSVEGTNELMKEADLILATGGPAMVKAAYSSGTPALGVGAGNVPAFIERSANIDLAIRNIIASKTFDNGTVCASEQSIITEKIISDKVINTLVNHGAYFLEGEKLEKVKAIMERPDGSMNPKIVGKSATRIARMAGIEIPTNTCLLVAKEKGVGDDFPFSKEKLTSLIGFYIVEDWQEACELCFQLLRQGGIGHSLAIHSENESVIREFAMKKPVSRMLVNTPSTQGAVGITTNLAPALTLGCGTVGGSSTSDNIGPMHLFNIRRVAYGIKNVQQDIQQNTNNEYNKTINNSSVDVKLIASLIMEQLKKMGNE